MAGTPTEGELQDQWKRAVSILDTTRIHIDATMANAGGLFDALEQALEGQFTPVQLANAISRYRATLSQLLDPATALEFLSAIVFEYADLIEADAGAKLTFGSGFTDIGELFAALYQYFVDNSLTVETRAISYDTSATAGSGNVGNGAFTRLTEDSNGFNLEFCHVERKLFVCVNAESSGVEKEAEVFEFVGAKSNFDALLRDTFGSGEKSRQFITAKNAGSGAGGSLLSNSSFSVFDSAATNRFTGWTPTFGGAAAAADVTQQTGTEGTDFYRTHPGSSTNGSLKIAMDSSGDTVTLKQAIAAMRVSRLDPDTPYFLRMMVNKTVGSAAGGTVNLRLGSQTATITISSLGANWREIFIAADKNTWFRGFNADPMDVEVEWTAGTGGFLLIDDVLFCPYDEIDGTYWVLRANSTSPVAWQVDDILAFTDTGGAPATGKIQWWNFVSGLGYLPSSGTATLADPATVL